MKKAFLTGITGQDGSYLAELLLQKGYEVHGLIRRASTFNTRRIDHIYRDPHDADPRLFLHHGDLSNSEQLTNLIYSLRPDEVYHLGAQSHVQVSFEIPEYTGIVTGISTTKVLDAIRHSGVKTHFYNAASSEMFGKSPPPQDELTPFQPCNPYSAAKVYGYWITKMYREGYSLFACNGILFNHESPRRGETFVTRKITRGLARILAGKQKKLYLGNLNARRDWGYSPEYCEAMWQILQAETPGDYVIGTGESHTVREFLVEAFEYAGLDWNEYVEIDPRHFRPVETENLMANPAKARKNLGWAPKVGFNDLIRIMVDADLEAFGLESPGEGKIILQSHFGAWHQWKGAVEESISSGEHAEL